MARPLAVAILLTDGWRVVAERIPIPAGPTNVRKRPPLFRALGAREPPDVVDVDGAQYRVLNVLKHNSWAATAIYVSATGERIICKFNRVHPVIGIPVAWVGRALAAREADFTRRLADLEWVPDLRGPVTANGRELKNALARTYIEGAPFTGDTKVDAAFFVRLKTLLEAVHAREIAYVDLHKRENIIIDAEGRPHLLDFQVSFRLGRHWPANGRLARFILRQLQEMDDYHFRKHYANCLVDELSAEEYARCKEPPALVRAHRVVGVPLRQLRRRLLVLFKVRDRTGDARSELEPEDAFRTHET